MLSPVYQRQAINTPTPIAPSLQVFIANSGNPGIAPNSNNLNQGDTGALVVKFNKNMHREKPSMHITKHFFCLVFTQMSKFGFDWQTYYFQIENCKIMSL